MKRLSLALALLAGPALAQPGAGPQAPTPVASRPPPRDIAYPGVLELAVDARDVDHKILHVRERLPLHPGGGPLVLLYPQWESASHAPTLEANTLSDLHVTSAGRLVPWRRDPFDPYAFHLEFPPDTRELLIEFDYLSPIGGGALEMTPAMLALAWSHAVLYPAGWYARDIPVQARLTLPAGFTDVTSLERATAAAPGVSDVRYAPVSLETLVDSPVYAGRHVRTLPLGAVGAAPVRLDLIADTSTQLELAPQELGRLRALVQETAAVFGRPHFASYDVIASLSDSLPATGGTEHQRSGENNFTPDFLAQPDRNLIYQDLIAHELVHSWNGKSRQPQGLWTADFNTRSDDSLLWVYEGQTEYWGLVLAARAGLRTPQQTLDYLAVRAAEARARVGRSWKSLADSALDPVFDAHHTVSWRDWQGREAYYPEGVLLWLDIDTLLRERTHGAHSLDTFARRFFGGDEPSQTIRTYTFDDLVAALNAELPMDWRLFLQARLEAHDDAHLYDGLTRGGFALADAAVATEAAREAEADEGGLDLRTGLGLLVSGGGRVRRVAWDSPAFRAGLAPGAVLKSVDGTPFADEVLRTALGRGELRLSFVQDGATRTVVVRNARRQTWPVLRANDRRSWLTEILKPRTA